jgi:hypothetical protein
MDAYLDGVSGVGFLEADALALIGAGVQQLPGHPMFGNPVVGPERVTVTVGDVVVDPVLDGTSKADPSSGSTIWSATANDQSYDNFWIVIQGHSPEDPNFDFYAAGNMGLAIDVADTNWALIHPVDAQGDELTQYWYLAYFLGDPLAQDDTVINPIEYRVAQNIYKETSTMGGVIKTEYTYPKFHVAFLSIPEPATLGMLLTAGLLGLAVRRRGTC